MQYNIMLHAQFLKHIVCIIAHYEIGLLSEERKIAEDKTACVLIMLHYVTRTKHTKTLGRPYGSASQVNTQFTQSNIN